MSNDESTNESAQGGPMVSRKTMTSYSDSFTVTRADLDAADLADISMLVMADAGPAFSFVDLARRMATAAYVAACDHEELEFFAMMERQRIARSEYPAKLAAWQAYRKRECDAFEERITRGVRFTADDIQRFVDGVWSSKPDDPDADLKLPKLRATAARPGR